MYYQNDFKKMEKYFSGDELAKQDFENCVRVLGWKNIGEGERKKIKII